MYFLKAEYDKVREEVKMMDRETLLLRQEEWRQMRLPEKEVVWLFIIEDDLSPPIFHRTRWITILGFKTNVRRGERKYV